jgi:Zn finger protein HypA/HybF involved in hydrogenase expression
MHEYALMKAVVDSVTRRLVATGGTPRTVDTVALRVGRLAVHSEVSCRQAFEAETHGTRLEGARLDLTILSPVAECAACGYVGPLPDSTAGDRRHSHEIDGEPHMRAGHGRAWPLASAVAAGGAIGETDDGEDDEEAMPYADCPRCGALAYLRSGHEIESIEVVFTGADVQGVDV